MKSPEEMSTVVAAVVGRLVADYTPESIIRIPPDLAGDPGAVPEIDLLIVKNTTEGFDDRRARVLSMVEEVDPSVTADAVVLTPDELSRRQVLGDFILAEILRYGENLYTAEGA